jgi:hypothetical protein
MVVVFYQSTIDGGGIGTGFFLYPNSEINLTALQRLGNQLAQLHFLFAIEGGYARLDV